MLSNLQRADHRTDAILSTFDTNISGVINQARLRVALRLRSLLDLDANGDVLPTAANVRIIQSLPKIFQQAMEAAGYDETVALFLGSFEGGIPLFEDVLKQITDDYRIKRVAFDAEDRAYFSAVKKGVLLNLDDVVEQAAISARKRAVFLVGGSPFEAVAAELSERLGTSIGQSQGLAATGISTFYRTIANRGYEKIENDLGKPLRYVYTGPPASDVFIRPFCEKLMKQAAQGRTWTREQIDRMDNGQLDDVFTTCGGWRCRHQWAVALESKRR